MRKTELWEFQRPSEELQAQRRAFLIEAVDRYNRGERLPPPVLPPLFDSQPIAVKTVRGRLETRMNRAARLVHEMTEASTFEALERLRGQFYVLKCEIKRFCKHNGIEVPALPCAPPSSLPNARPRELGRLRAS